MQIEHKRIVITGAASGIGRALLYELSPYPAQIMAVDLDGAKLAAALEKLPGKASLVTPFSCDLSKKDQVDVLFAYAMELWGGIDLFIANAGFAYYESLESADWERLERIYQLNVFSPIYTAVKMRELNTGRPYKVVIMASAMGLLAIPGYAVYGSTKAAVHRFAEGYRLELDDASQLTLVYPIGTRTNFFETAAKSSAPQLWPTQSPDHVARVVVKGIERDKASIYPSLAFRLILFLDRFSPLLRWLEQRLELRRFKRWFSRQPRDIR